MESVEQTLAGFGIAESRIHVEDFEIFRHEGVTRTIEAFRLERPSAEPPLSSITIVRYVRQDSFVADLESTLGLLGDHAERMERFAVQYGIEIIVHLYVQQLEAGRAAAIASYAGTRALDRLAFFFDMDALNPQTAPGIRKALAALCEDPGVRNNSKVRIGNLPFCLAPQGRFKFLYRDAIEPVKGQSVAQRSLVRDIREKDFDFHEACKHCRCRKACYTYTEIEDYAGSEAVLRPRRETTVVFAGGSISPGDVPPDADVVWAGPAEQGDMLAAVLEGFSTILVIDGYFYSRFPCTTFEVMLALEHGLNVFGSSSIGALRAVELSSYGMEGAGTVFGYLNGREVKPYHVVAQAYDDNDRPVTTPLVQITCFLENAVAAAVISAEDGRRCQAAVDAMHFTELSIGNVFRTMEKTEGVSDGAVNSLRDCLEKNQAAFDIKKRDALLLLSGFRERMRSRPARYAAALMRDERQRQCALVSDKFGRSDDLSLPGGWNAGANDGTPGEGSTRDNRECTAGETCDRARKLLEGLNMTLADTSNYDRADNHVLSVFFVPLYFYNYSPSSATGNGDVFEESLASAYMELVERLPAAAAVFPGRPVGNVEGRVLDPEILPQFYNWGGSDEEKQTAIDSHGYVRVTDIVSEEPVHIPKAAVMFEYSGTDGNASGNSIREAALYGIYELVERDTCQMHLLDADLRERLPGFQLAAGVVTDPRSERLMEQAEEKGCSMVLFELPNLYDLPCVMCHVYDRNREIQCHGGIAVRADFQGAIRAVLQEAYMQYITYFVGTRDDYRSFAPLKRAQLAYDYARETYLKAPGRAAGLAESRSFGNVGEELDCVMQALTGAGVSQILVANIGPHEDYGLSSLKVIIPGLDLWFCPDYQPSPYLRERTDELKGETGL
ncbi:MAG: YcaO-like family protein [Kiritimatiellia bacterium]|nr:YcaO-like family protein [Kiritimatiellia bacterium]MDP6848087.1 YcaO-like family protein [Kiritimatiellia bacterium]